MNALHRRGSAVTLGLTVALLGWPSMANPYRLDDRADFDRLLRDLITHKRHVELDGVVVGIRIAEAVGAIRLACDRLAIGEQPRLELGDLRYLFLTGKPVRVRLTRTDTAAVVFDEVLLVPPFQPFRTAQFWTDGTVLLGAVRDDQYEAPVLVQISTIDGEKQERVIAERNSVFAWTRREVAQVAEPDDRDMEAERELGDALELRLASIGREQGVLVQLPRALWAKHGISGLEGKVVCDGAAVASFECSRPVDVATPVSWLAQGATDPGFAPVRLRLMGDHDQSRLALSRASRMNVEVRPCATWSCGHQERGPHVVIHKPLSR